MSTSPIASIFEFLEDQMEYTNPFGVTVETFSWHKVKVSADHPKFKTGKTINEVRIIGDNLHIAALLNLLGITSLAQVNRLKPLKLVELFEQGFAEIYIVVDINKDQFASFRKFGDSIITRGLDDKEIITLPKASLRKMMTYTLELTKATS